MKYVRGNLSNPWGVRDALEQLGGDFGNKFGHWCCNSSLIFTVEENGDIQTYGNQLEDKPWDSVGKTIWSVDKQKKIIEEGEEVIIPRLTKKIVYTNNSGFNNFIISAIYPDKIIAVDEMLPEKFEECVPEENCLGYYSGKTGPKLDRGMAKAECVRAYNNMINFFSEYGTE